ncbi:MAG: DMT family transporter [Clostridia bacterium]|nr:DMT family transporter [Clostridia bacterium]
MQLQDPKSRIFSNPFAIVLIALLCCALWGSATPAIKTGYELLDMIDPSVSSSPNVPSILLFAGIRFFFAGLLTILIFSVARGKFLYPKRENLGRVGIISVFQTIVQYLFFYIGLANTTGVKGTIASGSSTFFALLISALIFKQERLTVKKIVACVLGFAGIIAVNLDGLTFDMNFPGDCFVIFSAISAGTSSVLIKRFSSHEDPVTLSGYQFMVGGVFMIIVGLCFGGRIYVKEFADVAILAYLALLSAIAYSLWGILLKYNPVSKITVFNFSTPIFGTLLSVLILPDSKGVNPINLVITLLLVSAGIFLLNYRPSEKAPPSVQDGSEATASEE